MSIALGAIKTSKPSAATKRNEANAKKAIYWGRKYNQLNDARDRADGDGNERLYRQLDRQCESTFDKYQDFLSELPKREQAKIEKLIFKY